VDCSSEPREYDWFVTYPGGQPESQQPYQPPYGQPYNQPQPYQQPHEQPPVSAVPYQQQPVSSQPYGQPYGQPGQYLPQPAGGSDQRGGKWALIGGGLFLLFVVLVVGGYFAVQQVFVHTPTEVVEAYLKEATKDNPDPAQLERYLCKDEAKQLEKELSNSGSSSSDSSSSNTVLDWHVTGESISGNTATVYTQFTIKTSGSRTTTEELKLTLIKEGRAWKICGYEA
jgi:hypothetical protein